MHVPCISVIHIVYIYMYVIGNYGNYSVLQQQKVYISKLNIILVQVSYLADMTHH